MVRLGERDILNLSRIKYHGVMQALSSGLCGKCLGISRGVRRADRERGPLNYVPKAGGGWTGQCPQQRQETFIIEEPTLRSLLSLEYRVLTSFPQGSLFAEAGLVLIHGCLFTAYVFFFHSRVKEALVPPCGSNEQSWNCLTGCSVGPGTPVCFFTMFCLNICSFYTRIFLSFI